MNTSGSKPSTWGPFKVWRRFNIWRAKRMYRRIEQTSREMTILKEIADDIMRENAVPPCPLFDRLDEGEK